MKTFKQKSERLKVLALATLVSTAPAAMAQDPLLDDVDNIYNSQEIDVEGQFTKKGPSAADRMAKRRHRMEKQNEEMVRKKIENIRIREEQKLARQLRSAFQGGTANLDTVTTTQSATNKKVEKVAPVVKREKRLKVVPHIGLLNINGDKDVDVESSNNIGLDIEGMVHSHISIGVGVTFTKMKLIDNSNEFVNQNYAVNQNYNPNNYYNQYGWYNPYYNNNQNYQNQYLDGREMEYQRLNIAVNSKFYFTTGMFRPYAGVGLGYNKVDLEYTENDILAFDNYQFGNEDYNGSYMSGSLLAGAEINFNDTVGISLEFKYEKAITESDSDNDNDNNNNINQIGFNGSIVNPDQQRLENVAGALEDSNFLSATAGLVIKF